MATRGYRDEEGGGTCRESGAATEMRASYTPFGYPSNYVPPLPGATDYFPVNLCATVGAWECGEHAPLTIADDGEVI